MNLADFKNKKNLVPKSQRFNKNASVKFSKAKTYDSIFKRVAKGVIISDAGTKFVQVKVNSKTYDVLREHIEFNQEPASTPFTFIKFLTTEKKPWDKLTKQDQKAFSPFIINKWLSMNHKLIYLVSGMQRFTVGSLSPKLVYELYLKTLPKGYLELNYIKGNSEIKYSDKLITFFAEQFKESKRNIIDWIELTSTDHLLNKLNIKDIHELEEVYKIK